MIVMAHSSAALFGAPLAAQRAGALILLGSYFFPSQDYHASLYEWSRSVPPAAFAFSVLEGLLTFGLEYPMNRGEAVACAGL